MLIYTIVCAHLPASRNNEEGHHRHGAGDGHEAGGRRKCDRLGSLLRQGGSLADSFSHNQLRVDNQLPTTWLALQHFSVTSIFTSTLSSHVLHTPNLACTAALFCHQHLHLQGRPRAPAADPAARRAVHWRLRRRQCWRLRAGLSRPALERGPALLSHCPAAGQRGCPQLIGPPEPSPREGGRRTPPLERAAHDLCRSCSTEHTGGPIEVCYSLAYCISMITDFQLRAQQLSPYFLTNSNLRNSSIHVASQSTPLLHCC